MIKKTWAVVLIMLVVLSAPHLLRAEDNDLAEYYNDFLHRGDAADVNAPVIAKMDRKLTFVAVNASTKADEEIISTLGGLTRLTGMPLRYGSVREKFNAFIMYSDNISETYKGVGSAFIKSFLKDEALYNKIGSELSGDELCYRFVFYRGGYIAGGILFVNNRALNTDMHARCLLMWGLGLYGFEPNRTSSLNSILAQDHHSKLTALDEAAVKDFYSRDVPLGLPISEFLELLASNSGM
ncbi:MAG: hypothetical protein NUV50_07195 [Rhodospirillales bacterium]|nr:hypothetical protein [Rhodospirillales bacterium]